MTLRERLQGMNVNGYNEDIMHLSLSQLSKLTGERTSSSAKMHLIIQLHDFLTDPIKVKGVWRGLSNFERACLQDYVVARGYLFHEGVEILAKEYKIKERGLGKFAWRKDKDVSGYFAEKSKIGLFFIDGQMPDEVVKVVVDLLDPVVFDVRDAGVTAQELEEVYVFEQDEQLCNDLIQAVKYAVGGKMKVTAASGFPTKAGLKNVNNLLSNKEYATEYINMEMMRKSEDMYRLFGLYTLLIDADLFERRGTSLDLTSDGKKFLSLPFSEQASLLLNTYKKSKHIDEVARIKGQKFQVGCVEGLIEARQEVLTILSNMPYNVWMNMEVFVAQIFKCKRYFLCEHVHQIIYGNSSYSYSYGYGGLRIENWEDVERSYLDVILLEYLAPLGMIDVAVEEVEIINEMANTSTDRLEVAYFRVTELGAYLLGSKEDYEDLSMRNKVDNDLWIDEWQQVVVGESKKEHQHHIFFEAFCERIEQGDKVYYPLNFSAVLRAFNGGISLEEVWTYLKTYTTKPLPTYLEGVFERWKEDQKKVRIRTVTILECEDETILEELQVTPGVQKHTKQVLRQVVELTPNTSEKVKKEVEKQCYFCSIEKEKEV